MKVLQDKFNEPVLKVEPSDIQKIAGELGLRMGGLLRAREAIMFACHCSENLKRFSTDRLVRWFVQSIHDKNLHPQDTARQTFQQT